MRTVTIKEFEENFDEMFEEVELGEIFCLCDDDGANVAILIPYDIYKNNAPDIDDPDI